jgi:hypothetical protein
VENSILISTKKILGIGVDYPVFDPDIITHINSTFSIVNQLGVIPDPGFMIEDDEAEWADLELPENQLNLLKTYVFLRVRMLFDPPNTSFLISAVNQQLEEYEHRLSYLREDLIPIPEEVRYDYDYCRRIY